MDNKYDDLKIENQLCFPLYACAKEVVRKYKPYLDPLDLTYTQYIAMMVLWSKEVITVKDLGKALYLDSGTLTPLLKKMEAKGYVIRRRSSIDERNLEVTLTEKGQKLREQALEIPIKVGNLFDLEESEAVELYRLLYKVLKSLE